jgi:hypothetical protein
MSVGAEELIERLKQVFSILINAEQSCVIGFETIFQKFFDAEGMNNSGLEIPLRKDFRYLFFMHRFRRKKRWQEKVEG